MVRIPMVLRYVDILHHYKSRYLMRPNLPLLTCWGFTEVLGYLRQRSFCLKKSVFLPPTMLASPCLDIWIWIFSSLRSGEHNEDERMREECVVTIEAVAVVQIDSTLFLLQ